METKFNWAYKNKIEVSSNLLNYQEEKPFLSNLLYPDNHNFGLALGRKNSLIDPLARTYTHTLSLTHTQIHTHTHTLRKLTQHTPFSLE